MHLVCSHETSHNQETLAMKSKSYALSMLFIATTLLLLSGCATIVNDPNIPISFSFSDGSSGKCTFKNKRGVWESDIPAKGVMIRRSDDALTYECETVDGREANGSVKSEVEGGKMTASVLLFDLGITDAITDKHRRYQPEVIIQVPSKDKTTEG